MIGIIAALGLLYVGSVLTAYAVGIGAVTGFDVNDRRGQDQAAVGVILLLVGLVVLALALLDVLG